MERKGHMSPHYLLAAETPSPAGLEGWCEQSSPGDIQAGVGCNESCRSLPRPSSAEQFSKQL